jgi:hypothetical protein
VSFRTFVATRRQQVAEVVHLVPANTAEVATANVRLVKENRRAWRRRHDKSDNDKVLTTSAYQRGRASPIRLALKSFDYPHPLVEPFLCHTVYYIPLLYSIIFSGLELSAKKTALRSQQLPQPPDVFLES